MLLHWYACISINTYCYETYHISLKIVWWALSNASLIMQICLVIHKISIGHKGWYRWTTCNFLIKKERAIRYYQNDIGISTHSSAGNTLGIESGDYISRTRIWVYRRTKWLQNRHRNNLWRARIAYGHWKVQWQFQGWEAKMLQLQ